MYLHQPLIRALLELFTTLPCSNPQSMHPCSSSLTVAALIAVCFIGLLPGYFASGTDTGTTSPTKDALIGTLCPIGYICPGSTDTDAATVTFSGSSPVMIPSATLTAAMTVKRCDAEFSFTASQTATAAALWTRTLGATTKEECCKSALLLCGSANI